MLRGFEETKISIQELRNEEKILQNSNKISYISNKLPQIVIKEIIMKILSNELYKTNKIEGIETVKSEIHSSLKDNRISNKKSNKLDGIIKKYKDIMEKNLIECMV